MWIWQRHRTPPCRHTKNAMQKQQQSPLPDAAPLLAGPKQRASNEPTGCCASIYRVRTTDNGQRTTDHGLPITDHTMDCSTGWFQYVRPYRKAKDQSLSRRPKTLPRPDWARLAWRCYSPAGMGETARRTPSLLLQLGPSGQGEWRRERSCTDVQWTWLARRLRRAQLARKLRSHASPTPPPAILPNIPPTPPQIKTFDFLSRVHFLCFDLRRFRIRLPFRSLLRVENSVDSRSHSSSRFSLALSQSDSTASVKTD